MLSVSLDLPEFEVVKQEELTSSYVVVVQKNSVKERCSFCGFLSSFVHDRRTRKVRDLDILNKQVYLLIKVKRYRCLNCSEVFSECYDSIEPGKHQTNRLREHLYQLCQDTTIKHVSEKYHIPYTTLERIYYSVAQEKALIHKEAITQATDKDDLVLSLDEVAVRKGHQYETVLLDAKLGCILGMIHQRSYESTSQLLTNYISSSQAVKTVVVDMWDPFHKAIKSLFPLASIVIDKYHVVQKVTQALDKVRKKYPKLKKARFLLLKGYEKLSEQQKVRLDELLEEYPLLASAYYLKETFREMYKLDNYNDAEESFEEWIQLAWSSPYPSFHEVAKTLENWKAEILQYFLSRYTNGRTEGTNHKVKNIKRRAYGYRNLERFRLRVFLECTGNTYKKQVA
ncbi:MAG TPA: ISL3 family transposase [Niallia sp.]|nr:ISL3 family transposase [Niallia sp.]